MSVSARQARWLVPALTVLVFAAPCVPAEEVKGKWRFEIHAGGVDPGDEIQSESENAAVILSSDGSTLTIEDPRPPNTKAARIEPDLYVELRASYGLHEWKNGEIILDVGVGHYDSRIEDIEFSYAFDRDPFQSLVQSSGTQRRPFFTTELLEGGQLKMMPVSVSVLARYRPTKRFNPYIGAGIGYFFNEFKESDRWREVADALDESAVAYLGNTPGRPTFRQLIVEPGDSTLQFQVIDIPPWVRDLYDIPFNSMTASINGHDMERPKISTPESAFFEVKGGAEWQWRPTTAVFAELRFSWAAEEIKITADGREQFGEAMPNGLFLAGEEPAPFAGFPAYISQGGLVTSGGPQPGFYLLNGGVLDYGGFTLTLGLRFTL